MTTEEKIKRLKAVAAANAKEPVKAVAQRLAKSGIYTDKGNLKAVYGGTRKTPA